MTRLLHVSTYPHPAVTTLASRPKLASSDTDADRLAVHAATRHVSGTRGAVAKRRGHPGHSVVPTHRVEAALPTRTPSAAAADGQASA